MKKLLTVILLVLTSSLLYSQSWLKEVQIDNNYQVIGKNIIINDPGIKAGASVKITYENHIQYAFVKKNNAVAQTTISKYLAKKLGLKNNSQIRIEIVRSKTKSLVQAHNENYK
jgi:hypothetical protein